MGVAALALGLMHVGAPVALLRDPSSGRVAMMGLSGLNLLVDGGFAAYLGAVEGDPVAYAFAALVVANAAIFALFRRRDVADWSDRGRKR